MAIKSWWEGVRGEWYLLLQAILLALLIFGPESQPGLPFWGWPAWLSIVVAGALLLIGSCIALAGTVALGKNLSPLPKPKEGGTLIVTGVYRFVRHPIYSGIIFMAFGYAVWRESWLTIGYATLLFLFFEIKSRREERWLIEKFPQYAEYRKRVNRFIPFR